MTTERSVARLPLRAADGSPALRGRPEPAERGVSSGEGRELLAWLEDARQARDNALSRLLDALYQVALRWARHRLRGLPDGADDAFDVAQEVVIRISIRLDQCRATSDQEIVGWTIAITRRAVADLLRAPAFRHEKLRRVSTESASGELDEVAFWTWIEQETGGGSDEALHAFGSDMASDATKGVRQTSAGRILIQRAACSAYEALPEVTRQVVNARLVESESWRGIGDALGITADAAKRRYQRAQGGLRRSILEHVAELPECQRATAVFVLLSWGVPIPGRPRPRRRASTPAPSSR